MYAISNWSLSLKIHWYTTENDHERPFSVVPKPNSYGFYEEMVPPKSKKSISSTGICMG